MNPEIPIENYQTFIEEFYDDLQYKYKLSTMNQMIDYPVDLSIILDKAHKKYHQD